MQNIEGGFIPLLLISAAVFAIDYYSEDGITG